MILMIWIVEKFASSSSSSFSFVFNLFVQPVLCILMCEIDSLHFCFFFHRRTLVLKLSL